MKNKQTLAVMKSQRRKKYFAAQQFGGKCQICGYDKCISALQFHHIDPSTKKYSPSYVIMRKKWEVAFAELQKCILVCANCHVEIHYNDLDISQIVTSAKTYDLECQRCNKPFQTKQPEQKYCGVTCQSISRRKVKIEPNKSDLKKLIESKTPWTKIGKMYGVSDNAMRKWAKKFDLI